jgi:hypothetical protein
MGTVAPDGPARVESSMDRASSLIFPGSRTIAGWWRQLQAHQPKALWIGYAFLHRIEAPIQVLRAIRLEQAVAPQPVELAALESRLRLPTPMTRRVLIGMQETGLLTCAADAWTLTERGESALAHQSYPERVHERRIFPFLERVDASGQRIAPAQFLPIAECVGVNWAVDDTHRFDIACLKECIAQPAAWKQSAGFPLDVEALATETTAAADWQQVVVDRPERTMLTLIQTATRELLGFAVKVDGWVLHDRAPALRGATTEHWQDLAPAPQATALQDAWRDWCRQQKLPASEVDSCMLTHESPRLEVTAPPRLVQRLQAAKSDLFRGDAWLLVGDGFVRTATQLALR